MSATSQVLVDRDAVDRVFASWDRPDSPGAALVITVDGQVAYTRGYGAANLEYGLPILPDTVFHVASVSKQFTAACVFMLALEGRLALDDEIRVHLPYVPDFGVPITVHQLIHHSSGLRDQWQLLRWAGWRMDDVITQEHLLRVIRRQERLNFAPGDEHVYCNSGYTLLAELVAAKTGQTLREFAAERIFRPLGMSRTLFYDDHEEIVPGRAYSYGPRHGGGFQKKVLSFANVGATSLFTTAVDLAKWLAYLGTIDGSDLARLMQTRLVLNSGIQHAYAGGLSVREHRGLRLIDHTGSDAGYRSYCGRYPDQGLGIAILCNLATMNPARLAGKVAESILGNVMQPAEAPPLETDPRSLGATLADYAGVYLGAGVGTEVRVTLAGETALQVVLSDGSPVELSSDLSMVGPDRFYARSLEQVVEFKRGAGPGAPVTALLASAGGNVTLRARRRLPELSRTAATSYEGRYYSLELDATYRVRAVGGELIVEHQRLQDLRLAPVGPDEFEVLAPGGATVVFTRDPARPTASPRGLHLSGPRCRQVEFVRVGDRS